jgi:ABC-type multidrug transport system fused ATPase/permease subunit
VGLPQFRYHTANSNLPTRNIRALVIIRAGITSIAISLPVLASVLAFVVYGLHHALDPATIFTSLTLFNMLRMPLMFLRTFPLPFYVYHLISAPPTAAALSTGVDAFNAFGRIQEVFEAESLPDDHLGNDDLENAIELDEASFTWDAPPPEPESKKDKGKDKGKAAKGSKKDKKGKQKHRPDTPTSASVPGSSRPSTSIDPEKSEKVFKIPQTTLTIPRGQVVAIVGPVGSGKSSFLQGLIGEMRRESGSVKFGGSISYCPQNAWIQVRVLLPSPLFSISLNDEL